MSKKIGRVEVSPSEKRVVPLGESRVNSGEQLKDQVQQEPEDLHTSTSITGQQEVVGDNRASITRSITESQ